jgi:hypothetical protein
MHHGLTKRLTASTAAALFQSGVCSRCILRLNGESDFTKTDDALLTQARDELLERSEADKHTNCTDKGESELRYIQ